MSPQERYLAHADAPSCCLRPAAFAAGPGRALSRWHRASVRSVPPWLEKKISVPSVTLWLIVSVPLWPIRN